MKKMITETCPHCVREITLEWDVKSDGYEIRCPYCGRRIMLCNECESCIESCSQCDWNPLTATCHKSKYNHWEEKSRRVVIDFEVDDAFAEMADKGTLDYVSDCIKMLLDDGIVISNGVVLDEDDTEDTEKINLVNKLFN